MTPATSSLTSLKEFASWDRDSSCWRTSEDTLLWDSTPFSGRWPTSGMTRDGSAYALPTWEPPTVGSDCSSSPLLPTATARDYKNTGTRERFNRSSAERGQPLTEVAVHLLPTPRTSDTNGPGAHGEGGKDLRTTVTLLPTPAVNDMGAGKTVEDWDAWTERMKAAHGTPRATDGTKGGPNQRGSSGDLMLPSAVHHLLPTPRATRCGSASETRDLLSNGGSTDQPLTVGPQSWDVPLPLQLSGIGSLGSQPDDDDSLLVSPSDSEAP